MGIPNHYICLLRNLYAGQEAIVRNGHETMESSKLGKEYIKAVYRHLVYLNYMQIQFIHSVVSNSLWPHGLQHTQLPCPSPTPRAYSNSCLLRWRCHPTISSSVVPFSSCLQFPSIRVFSNESVLLIGWLKCWSFSISISPSNEYSGLISFRMGWLDLLAVQGLSVLLIKI